MVSQFLKELEPFVYIDEDGNRAIKEDDLTALMCSHACSPDEMGRIHEALELHRVQIVPYGNEGNSELCKKILQTLEKANNIIDEPVDSLNAQQKEKVLSYIRKLTSKLICFAEKDDTEEDSVSEVSIKVVTNVVAAEENDEKKSNKKATGFVSKSLIIDVLEYLESVHHNSKGYTPQEMLDVILSRGINVSMSKDPHANLRGALPTLVSKELYPEYVKARSEDIVYQPSGKYTGTWRLSKYRKM